MIAFDPVPADLAVGADAPVSGLLGDISIQMAIISSIASAEVRPPII